MKELTLFFSETTQEERALYLMFLLFISVQAALTGSLIMVLFFLERAVYNLCS